MRTPYEVLNDPHLHESGAVTRLTHPGGGDIDAVGMGLPIRFSKTPAQFDQPAMALGAANEDVYGRLLGLSAQELDELHRAGVI